MRKQAVWMLLSVVIASVLILGGYVATAFSSADREPPEICIETTEIAISVQDAESSLLQGVTAWDDHDGDVTATLVVESLYGITEDSRATVTYAAFDKAGNVTKAERTVYLIDYESPHFTLSRALVFEFGSVSGVMDSVGVEDILDGDIRQHVKATMLTRGSTVTAEGTHEVQFRVTNSLGDTAEMIIPVEVYPIGSYDAELTLSEYLVYIPQGTVLNPESYLLSLATRREILDLSGVYPEGVRVMTNNSVDTGTPGVYDVTFTVSYTDGSGEDYTGYSRLMVIVEG